MITTRLKTLSLLLPLAGLLSLSSCSDDNDTAGSSQPATLKFRLTDAPASYDAVLVDIQEVRVHVGDEDDPNDSTAGWQSVDNIQPGVYDLLKLQNGLDTVLAEGEVSAGKLSQIRLILGDNNSLVVDGVTKNLMTPSGQTSGLKLQVNYDLEPGLYYEFWLDFDASRSVVAKGNGGYNLKPVIRVFTKNTTGAIAGHINPAAARPFIMAYDGTDTATSIADSLTGYFLMSGLNPGNYTVEVDADSTYSDTTLTGISVRQGVVTDLDTLNL